MMKKITVVHLEAGRNLYGGALQVVYLLEALKNNDTIENILICPNHSAIAERCQDICAVYTIAMYGDIDPGLTFRISKILKQTQADIIQIHSRRGADIWGLAAAKLAGCKSICTRRVDNSEPMWLTRFKYSRFDQVVAISEGIRKVLTQQGLRPEQVITIRDSVDTHKYQPMDTAESRLAEFGFTQEHLVLGIVAQLIPRKGHALLFNALSVLIKKYPRLRLLILGKGPCEQELAALATRLNIRGHVIFAGFRHDLEQLLPQLQLVVHPAITEGLGVALLQASACEVAIVASAVGGIPEAVEHNINGILVPPNDQDALIIAIEQLLLNTPLRKQLAKQGRKKMLTEFSIAAMAQAYVAVYCQLMH